MKGTSCAVLLFFLFLSGAVVSAQQAPSAPDTGIPLFGSFEDGKFDLVNRANLNVMFKVPIISVAGRGRPFSFALTYNSSIWSIGKTSLAAGAFAPVVDDIGNPTWGWNMMWPLGRIGYTFDTAQCEVPNEPGPGDPGGGPVTRMVRPRARIQYVSAGSRRGYHTEYVNSINNFSYTEPDGTVHRFPAAVYYDDWQNVCGGQFVSVTEDRDKSGYQIDISDPVNPKVTAPDGTIITEGSWTDSNGNVIQRQGLSGGFQYVDTAGKTVLKIVKPDSSTVHYKYTDTSGAEQTIELKLQNFPIQTSYSCSGILQYSGTATLPVSVQYPNGQRYSFAYQQGTGRISRVTLPTGGYYDYGWSQSVVCSDASPLDLSRTINDGADHVWSFGRGHNSSSWYTQETLPALPYGDSRRYYRYFLFTNGLLTSETMSLGSTTLRTTNTTWASDGTPASTTTILDDQNTQTKIETDYDYWSRLVAKREYAWGSGSPGSLVRSTTIAYWSSYPYRHKDRMTQMLVRDGSGTVVSRTDIAYDGTGISCVNGAAQHDDAGHGCSYTTRGNPTSITTYTNAAVPSGSITQNLFYDSLGNVTKIDVNGVVQKQMRFSSATQYAFPDSIISGPDGGPQLTVRATYNPYTGLLKTATDENEKVTSYAYDTMLRPASVTRPDNVVISYIYDDNGRSTTVSRPIQGTDVQREISYQDTLGRVLKTVTTDGAGNGGSTIEMQFDSWGRAYKISNPHDRIASAQFWTETRRDILDRLTAEILPDGNQTTYAYSGNTVTITDPAGRQRKQEVDALGRLVKVYEPDVNSSNALTQQTTYAYNILDKLTTVTQGAQTRNYVYDDLGRTTSLNIPEAGESRYLYNAFGQVTQRTDARGVITNYSYDTLNRPSQTAYNVGSTGVPATPAITYTYGTNTSLNNNGRLISLGAAGVEIDSFSYDQLGRIASISKNIAGATYNIIYGYNLAGQLVSTRYPSGRTVSQTYDTTGRLSQISDASRIYASQFSYNSAGQLLGYAVGNGVLASFNYSGARLQLGNLSYSRNLNTLFSLSFGYTQPNSGNNGQITAVTDNMAPAQTLAFSYDSLGRLTEGKTSDLSASGSWDISWRYDRYGNRTNQAQLGGTLAVTNQNISVNAKNQLTGGFGYDASGNMTNDGITSNYVYDAENRFVSLGTTVVNTYGANGLRVKSGTTIYVYSGTQVIAEYAAGAVATAPAKEYIYMGGQLLASLGSGGTPTYRHSDHLSARLFTDADGNVIGGQGHLPFGEPWYSWGATDKWKFVTYEHDDQTGLDYAIMRHYSGRLGRFMSPDPYDGSVSPENPQSWNRYAYVSNDPVDVVDPLGLCGWQLWGAFLMDDKGNPEKLLRTFWVWDGPCKSGGGGGGGTSKNVPAKPASPCKSLSSNGGTIPVNATFGQMRFQFNSQGALTGIGVQLTGQNDRVSSSNFTISPNTFVGLTMTSPGTVQFGFNNPVRFGSGMGQAYFQNATYSAGKFTQVSGAVAPFGIPLGSTTGDSTLLRWGLNGDLPFTSGLGSQAQQFGKLLSGLADLMSSSVSCSDLFPGE